MQENALYDRAVDVMAELVAADTARNAKDHRATRPLLDGVAQKLAPLGVRPTFVKFPPDPKRHTGLILSYGPEMAGGTVLSGHVDVVSVEGQPWQRPAFALTQDDEKFYGRGTTDMKGFIATALAVMDDFARAKRALTRPIHLALSCDEEGGFHCAPLLADALAAMQPRQVIVGEPTEFAIGIAHKGSVKIDVTVTGRAGHSGNPERCINANEIVTDLNLFMRNMQAVLKEKPDADFSPPHSVINLGVMQGGKAHNIVPDQASVTYFLRPVRADDRVAVLAELRGEVDELTQRYANPNIGALPHITVTSRVIDPFDGRGDNPAVAFMKGVLGETAPVATLPYNTEASFFQTRGLPTVVCGMGSIAQAHTADEFLRKDDFRKGLAMMQRVFAAHL